jgi:hypothetical protein
MGMTDQGHDDRCGPARYAFHTARHCTLRCRGARTLVPRVGTWLGQWEGGEVDHILCQLHRQVVLERLDMFDERAGSAGAHERPASAAAVRARQ